MDTGSTHFSDGVVGVLPNGTISSSNGRFKTQGTVSLNGSDVNVKDLQNNDTPTFSNVNLSNVSLLGQVKQMHYLVVRAGSIGYRVLGTKVSP